MFPDLLYQYQGDDLTSYFTRIERIAALLTIPQDNYAIQLGGLLCFSQSAEHYRHMFVLSGSNLVRHSSSLPLNLVAILITGYTCDVVGEGFHKFGSFVIMDQFLASLHLQI
ncbi:hypothetical protein E2C01_099780 [Portunus trituberculatus]|uniref:Uncharacterized protein n=1 Tax=Portunus trituberculatus TaxID=210409 RepID=A0A5B7KG85_PORTR|nr:hypothetical protein [Portunus trituberculatus]